MGCSSGKGKQAAFSPTGAASIDVDTTDHPRLLGGPSGALLRVGSSLAQKGSDLGHKGACLAQNGSSSLLEGGTGLVMRGSGLLSKANPGGLVSGRRSSSSEYLVVDVEEVELEQEDRAAELNERPKGNRLLRGSAALLWAASMSSAAFLTYTGELPAIFGSTLSNIILVVMASSVLAPIVKCIFPRVQRKIAEARGTNCYMWCCFAALWAGLAVLFIFLWHLGVMQVVIGCMFSQLIIVVLGLLLIIPCLVYTLPIIKKKIFEFPDRVKAKLWEIPPLILPLFESMMQEMLHKMEERILEKLKDMPKDVAGAVLSVGGSAGELGKKGLSKARRLTRMKSKSSVGTGSTVDGDGSESECDDQV